MAASYSASCCRRASIFKRKLRLHWSSILVILSFSSAFLLLKLGEDGRIPGRPIRQRLIGALHQINAVTTDAKFALRGPRPPSKPIVIVAIDSPSIAEFGRWPWHRDRMAQLINETFDSGAQLIGVDMVFSEPDVRTPEGLKAELRSRNLPELAEAYETDPLLRQAIAAHSERLVLGWQTESACQPALEGFAECQVTDAGFWRSIPKSYPRFALSSVHFEKRLQPQRTPLMSLVQLLPNLPGLTEVASHTGFYNAFPDPDGVIRTTYPIIFAAGHPYPSLALEMARLALHDELALEVRADQRLGSLRLQHSGYQLPLSELGQLRINFYGPSHTFPFVSAIDVLRKKPQAREQLKNSYVFIGVTVLGQLLTASWPIPSSLSSGAKSAS